LNLDKIDKTQERRKRYKSGEVLVDFLVRLSCPAFHG
jgi:hypothetical protein